MEIAKLRAARMLWAQIVAAFDGGPAARKIVIHGRSSAYNKTVLDPQVNMLRVTSEGFAAAIGGVDSLHLDPYDVVARTPDRFSRRIARNVQIILQEESKFTMPIDIAGGSYYIENLTRQFAERAWLLFQQIERSGGMAEALYAGLPQSMCAATADLRKADIETRRQVIVGTNLYADLTGKKLTGSACGPESVNIRADLDRPSPLPVGANNAQRRHLFDFGTRLDLREPAAVESAIAALRCGAALKDLLQTAAALDADRPTATALDLHRAAESFENLRSTADDLKERRGRGPEIFLANMGPVPQHKPRADFCKGFFEAAGFQIIDNNGFDSAEQAADAALASAAPVVVVCATDAAYPGCVPTLAARFKAQRPDGTLIVAGKQPEPVEKTFLEAGVDSFVHVRTNCHAFNKKLLEKYR